MRTKQRRIQVAMTASPFYRGRYKYTKAVGDVGRVNAVAKRRGITWEEAAKAVLEVEC